MPQTITFKLGTFYVAIAPAAGAWACGACFEEAVNGLAAQRARQGRAGERATRDEKK